jgi:hypothetical protein
MGLGFYDGLSRLFLNPIRGARDDGGLGFLKGLGSGSLDLIVRSSAGTPPSSETRCSFKVFGHFQHIR